jgi:ABC-type sugar transport system substrate-binding protein
MVFGLLLGSFSSLAAAAPIKIGTSLQGMTPFVLALVAALEENVARYNAQGVSVEMIMLDGEDDPAKQIAHVENFIEQGVDVILFNAISFHGAVPAVDMAVEAGIPVISLIGEVANQDKCVSFCGSKHYDSGVLVAENAVKENGEAFRYVVIEGVMGIDAQIQRMLGFNDVLSKYPNAVEVAVQSADWRRPDAMRLVENWIQAGHEFNVILSQNDNMALGAIEALKGANLLDKVKVYGVDGDNDALVSVKNGELAGTAFMSAMGQATHAVDYAVALAQGHPEKVEAFPVIPFEWVDISNVDEYLK